MLRLLLLALMRKLFRFETFKKNLSMLFCIELLIEFSKPKVRNNKEKVCFMKSLESRLKTSFKSFIIKFSLYDNESESCDLCICLKFIIQTLLFTMLYGDFP